MIKRLLSFMGLVLSLGLFAQPTNLDCANATIIPMGGPEVCIPVLGDNTGANDTTITPGCGDYQNNAVWFAVTIPPSGVALLEVSPDTGATAITDAAMAAYTGDCNNLSLEGCNDDTNGLFPYLEVTDLTPGSVLYVAVWRYGGNGEGTFNICAYQPPLCPDIDPTTLTLDSVSTDYASISWETLVDGSTFNFEYGPAGFAQGSGTTVFGTTGTDGPPVILTGLSILTNYDFYLWAACGELGTDTILGNFNTSAGELENDDCDSATPLTVAGPNDCQPTLASNEGATDSGIEHTCANYNGGDVWFSFVAPEGGAAYIETSSASGIADSGIALYEGTCDGLEEIACNDDSDGLFSLIQADSLTAGETYYVAVWEYGGDVFGAFNICVYEPPTCPAPNEFSIFADSLTADGQAFITWEVENPGAEFVLEYGVDGFELGTGETVTGIVGVDGPPAQITGLLPETGYNVYYTAICGPGDTSETVGPRFFTTLPTCPTPNWWEFQIDSLTSTEAFISWPNLTPGATFTIEYGEAGFEQGTGMTLSGQSGVDGPPAHITGLNSETGYEYYFSLVCSPGDTSGLVGPNFFETFATCQAANVQIDTAGYDFVTISWDLNNPGANYTIEVGPEGFVPGTGQTLTGITGTDGPPVTIPGLTISSNYDIYLQEVCAANDSAGLVGPVFVETASLPPANDNLCDAIGLTVNDEFNVYTNEGATSETEEPVGECDLWLVGEFESVWFSFVAPESGNVTVTTDTAEMELHDTSIAIYSLDGECSDMTGLTQIGCDGDGGDAGPNGWTSVATLTDLTPGETYYVQVDGYGPADGNFAIKVIESTPDAVEEFSTLELEMYPNPAETTINLVSSKLNGLLNIEIIDIEGRVVLTNRYTYNAGEQLQMDVTNIDAGMYLVRIISNQGIATQRLTIE